MAEGVSLPGLPELVECDPYRARLSADDCAARWRLAGETAKADWRDGPRIDLEHCVSCAVGRERASGPEAKKVKTMPKSCQIEGCKGRVVRLESGRQSHLCQAHLRERDERRQRASKASREKAKAAPVVEIAPSAAPEQPPTCSFFHCSAPCRPNPAPTGRRWTSYCEAHGLEPNPGKRSQAAEREWRLQQLEPQAVEPQAVEEQPPALPKLTFSEALQASVEDSFRGQIEFLERDRARLLRENGDLQERLAKALQQLDAQKLSLELHKSLERDRQQERLQLDPEKLPADELFRLSQYAVDQARSLLGRVG